MERMDRRKFLASAPCSEAASCWRVAEVEPARSRAREEPTETHPPIGQEPGTLSILEWPGYEAGGTKAQTYGMLAGTNYTDEFGADGLKYTYIVNDTQAVNKARQVRVRPHAPLHRERAGTTSTRASCSRGTRASCPATRT